MAHLMLSEKYQDCIVIIAQISQQFTFNVLRIIVFIFNVFIIPKYDL